MPTLAAKRDWSSFESELRYASSFSILERYHAVTVYAIPSGTFLFCYHLVKKGMNEQIFWRERLRLLTNNLGRGGIKAVADKINKTPSYISRLLSEPDTKQHRPITHQTCYLITKAYPSWLEENSVTKPTGFNQDRATYDSQVAVTILPKGKREQLSEKISQAMDTLNEDGLHVAFGFIKALVDEYPRQAKQTPSS